MERVLSIKEGFKGVGPEAGVYYTNQEILDRLKNFQVALNEGIYNKTHAENFTEREVYKHLESLAFSFDIDVMTSYFRLHENLNHLGKTIAQYINGMSGERMARKALKLISMDKGVKVLYNVCLEDEDTKAEYDALVLAPYGIFAVEVKNWYGTVKINQKGLLERDLHGKIIYDLSGRMSIKEALLRECLGDLFPSQYVSMLLFPNEKTEVIDEYHRQQFFVGCGISSDIRLYTKFGNILTEKQIDEIAERIMSHHKEQKTLCDVKIDEIVEDYAKLLVEIEEKAAARANAEESPEPDSVEEEQEEEQGICKRIFTKSNCKKAATVVLATTAVTLPICYLIHKNCD